MCPLDETPQALPTVVLAAEPLPPVEEIPVAALAAEPESAAVRPGWGPLLGMLFFGGMALALLIGVIVGLFWLLAEPMSQVLETLQEQAEQRRREREQARAGGPGANTTKPPPSLEEALVTDAPPTDEQIDVLRAADGEWSKQATKATEAADHGKALTAWVKVAEIRQRLRLWRAAAGAYSQAYGAAMELLEGREGNAILREQHVRYCLYAAQCLYKARYLTDAENLGQQALNLSRQGTEQFGPVEEFQELLAQSHILLGAVYRDLRREAEAEEQERQALQWWQQLAKEHREQPAYQGEYGRLLLSLGYLRRRQGRPQEAQRSFQAATVQLREVVAKPGPNPEYHLLLAQALLEQDQLLPAVGAVQPLEQARNRPALQYGLARIYARASACAELNDKQRREFADYTLRVLRTIHWYGYFRDPAELQQFQAEPDFGPLRGNPSFDSLMDDAKRGVRPKPLVET